MAIIEGSGTAVAAFRKAPPLPVKLLHADAIAPTRAHPSDAGLDLYALTNFEIGPHRHTTVRTGISVAIPTGMVGLVFNRSSLGFKYNVTLSNSCGVIDSGYTGEVKVALTNHDGDAWFDGQKGDRIAQLVIVPALLTDTVVVDELPDSHRGAGGLGSTGV